MIIRTMSWLNLYKSKKMRVVGLWNDLPWFYDVFGLSFLSRLGAIHIVMEGELSGEETTGLTG